METLGTTLGGGSDPVFGWFKYASGTPAYVLAPLHKLSLMKLVLCQRKHTYFSRHCDSAVLVKQQGLRTKVESKPLLHLLGCTTCVVDVPPLGMVTTRHQYPNVLWSPHTKLVSLLVEQRINL
jgi:hypothetical protein